MTLNLQHNKIVKDTMTARFEESVRANLVPMIENKYNGVLEIQMYEDYISDNFAHGGAWYYPLTVVVESGPFTEWIKWNMDKNSFKDGVPYSYVGKDLLAFSFAQPPEAFCEKLLGRSIYFGGTALPLRIETVVPNPTFLSGKYSQTFVDEMARQLTVAITDAMSVETLEGSTFSLALVFAPETYMEHTSENVTYRRLLIVDKGSAPRDFWIKWTRLDGATAYSVADHVSSDNIVFEIGEDVSQKVREKEYRCLIRLGKDKYHNAMGRKNVTDWRDLFKRAIRRGELVRVELATEEAENNNLNEQLAKVLGTELPAPAATMPEAETVDDDFTLALKKLAEEAIQIDDESDEPKQTSDSFVFAGLDVEESESVSDEPDDELELDEDEDDSDDILLVDERGDMLTAFDDGDDEDSDDEEEYIEISEDLDEEPADDESYEEFDEDEQAEDEGDETESDDENCDEEDDLCDIDDDDADLLADVRALEPDDDDEAEEPEVVTEVAEEPAAVEPTEEAAVEPAPVAEAKGDNVAVLNTAEIEAKIRAEIEAKIRLEYETKARAKAEEEADRLRREQDMLRSENERLQAQMARERREQAIKEEELRAEEARLRAQIELQLRAETRERERFAEAARAAVEQQRRLEAEQLKMQKEHADELRRHNEERIKAEKERRAEAAKAAELERARRAEAAAKPAPAPEVIKEDTKYTYTSKVVRLVFRRSVDPNITSKIHEIIKVTLEYYGKDKIYLKVRATVPDNQTVCLEFIKIPMEEMDLLRNIIKVLGNSGLGIAKAVVE